MVTGPSPARPDLSLVGDRSKDTLRLAETSVRQTLDAGRRLEHLLPGLVPVEEDVRRRVGMDTMRVLRCNQDWLSSFDMGRINDYLTTGAR